MLAIMTIIGIMMAVMGPSWKTISKVEKEKELIWRGHQFRLAIQRYYLYKGLQQFPSELSDLLKDPRSPAGARYLRKIYIDPMTGKDDWVVVQGGAGTSAGGMSTGIMGVHSKSEAEPLKKDNFDPEDAKFVGKTHYSEWPFTFDPNSLNQAAVVVTPGGTATTPGNTGTFGGTATTPGGTTNAQPQTSGN